MNKQQQPQLRGSVAPASAASNLDRVSCRFLQKKKVGRTWTVAQLTQKVLDQHWFTRQDYTCSSQAFHGKSSWLFKAHSKTTLPCSASKSCYNKRWRTFYWKVDPLCNRIKTENEPHKQSLHLSGQMDPQSTSHVFWLMAFCMRNNARYTRTKNSWPHDKKQIRNPIEQTMYRGLAQLQTYLKKGTEDSHLEQIDLIWSKWLFIWWTLNSKCIKGKSGLCRNWALLIVMKDALWHVKPENTRLQ